MNYTEVLYKKYKNEMKYLVDFPIMGSNLFEKYLFKKLKDMKQISILQENNLQGILFYECWEDKGIRYCYIPECGYYAENEKILIKLFQELAGKVVDDKKCQFMVNLYAHDYESIQAFHMMQFGTMSEKCVKKISDTNNNINSLYDIRVLDKNEIESMWDEIWNNTNAIVEHLRKSPIFYPGKEFTEEVYKEFFMDDETELIAAFSDDKVIGIIEWNRERNELTCGTSVSVNVGEAYVSPEYRGEGLARALLQYAQARAKHEGAEYMWVEHGTANPNARGFWNKYFSTYEYELVRTIN